MNRNEVVESWELAMGLTVVKTSVSLQSARGSEALKYSVGAQVTATSLFLNRLGATTGE